MSTRGSGPEVLVNGDTNGDGVRDLSDAVWLLDWLFLGGEEPVPFAVSEIERFVDNGDGTVTDLSTGLMWLQGVADTNGDGTGNNEDTLPGPAAREFAEQFEFAGHDDWTLPNTVELMNIVDTRFSPVFDPAFETPDTYLWISSTNAGDPCHGASFAMSSDGFTPRSR